MKQCAVKMAQAFKEAKVSKKSKRVSLSHQTVATRVNDLNEHVSLKKRDIMKNYIHFSLALDESTVM